MPSVKSSLFKIRLKIRRFVPFSKTYLFWKKYIYHLNYRLVSLHAKLAFPRHCWVAHQSGICQNISTVGRTISWCTAEKLSEEIASCTNESIETWATMATECTYFSALELDLCQAVATEVSFARIGAINLIQWYLLKKIVLYFNVEFKM